MEGYHGCRGGDCEHHEDEPCIKISQENFTKFFTKFYPCRSHALKRREVEVELWKECVAGCPVQKLESLQQWLHQLVQIDYVEDII